MALGRKISTVYVQNRDYGSDPQWRYEFRVTNAQSDLGQVNWTSATDEDLGGSLRSNLRGFRANVSLDWPKLHSAVVTGTGTTMRAFFNSMINSIVINQDQYIELSLDGIDYFNVVPESGSINNSIKNQITRPRGSINFRGREILTVIPEYLEAPSI